MPSGSVRVRISTPSMSSRSSVYTPHLRAHLWAGGGGSETIKAHGLFGRRIEAIQACSVMPPGFRNRLYCSVSLAQHPRWGYLRLHLLLKRELGSINHKRVKR